MIRVCQVKNAQEELVIITHSRITATAASVGHTHEAWGNPGQSIISTPTFYGLQ